MLGLIVFVVAAWTAYHYVWRAVFPGVDQAIVQDDAGILSRDQVDGIRRYHAELLKEHDIDYRTVIRSGVGGDISRFAFRYFAEHGVGRLSDSGRGLLLVIDADNDLVRLEVARALEGVYTDRFVSYIQHRQMIPFFRSERVADGILASTELIVTRAQDAERGRAFVPPMPAGTVGGGAVNRARIGAGDDGGFRDGRDVAAPANDPRAVLAAYRGAMAQRNGAPGLSIYTRGTQAFLSQWTMTPAQMDNEARSLEDCPERILKTEAIYAVLRHPVAARRCPPYFFKMEDGQWRLDLTMMSKAIRFNHRNHWHFDTAYGIRDRHYAFAFEDWSFDQRGFPHPAGDRP